MNKRDTLAVKYWGVRGSIPTPLPSKDLRNKQVELIKQIIQDGGSEKLFDISKPETIEKYLDKIPFSLSNTYGGDTTCLEIQASDSPLIIVDAGTGIRNLGNEIVKRLFSKQKLNPLNTKEKFKEIHIFFTHYHWDHIQGFPFFTPSFIAGDKRLKLYFYGKRDARVQLSEVLKGQQCYPNFPVVWDDVPCHKNYMELRRLNPKKLKIGEVEVSYRELSHPDFVFAYRFDVKGKSFVCATDTEHKDSSDPRLLQLAQDADILYYDAQYTPEEYVGEAGSITGGFSKFDWGHSTYEWAIKNALTANVKKVVLGHHEPVRDDFFLDKLQKRALKFLEKQLSLPQNKGKTLEVELGYQGLKQML